MRIASLLPATTEWVCALGGAEDLVARSHECDGPPGLADVPAVTRAAFPEAEGSRAIDDAVQARLNEGLSLYDVDTERLRALRPDLVLTQTQCEICAVSRAEIDEALATWEGNGAPTPRLLSLAPSTLKEAFEAGLTIGRAIDRLDAAMAFLTKQERRLQRLRENIGLDEKGGGEEADKDAAPWRPAERPTVACVEWLDPLMTAGHWTPGLARQAGGQAVLAEEGARSQVVTWEALRAADPDVLAVMPCGFSMKETIRDLAVLTDRPGFDRLRAVRDGRVFLFDGNAYFNRPGPRLYRSAALLAAALHPERARAFVDPRPAEMRLLREVMA